MFINLKNRIENIYVNDFISELSIKWSDSIESLDKYDTSRMLMQNKFYNHYIKPYHDKKDRIIVLKNQFSCNTLPWLRIIIEIEHARK